MTITLRIKEIGCLLCFILFQLLSSPNASAAELWLIYAEGDIAEKDSPAASSPSIDVAGFQYFGYVKFSDPPDPATCIDSQPTTIKAMRIYEQVFKKPATDKKNDTPVVRYPGKPTINRKDDTQVVLYSAKAMNFVCTKKEDAFTQTDAPMVSSAGFEVQAAKSMNGQATQPQVLAFLCDLESRDKGNTRITFTVEKKAVGEPAQTNVNVAIDDTLKKKVVLSQAIRVHELYRFRITSGPVFSSLITNNRTFSTVTNAAGQQVISSSQANDAPVNFPVFLKTYWSPDGRDILVDPPHWYSPERINPIIGINLVDNPFKNFYAGLSWEPVLGVDIVAGAHFAKITQLAGGFTDGQIVASGTQPPTTNKFLTGGFVGVTADVGVIGSWLGSQITKTIKEGLR
jgi:hypothetical protein